MKKSLLVAAIALLLSACGSSVKLDSAPVEDKSGTKVVAPESNSTAVAQSTVTPVAADTATSNAAMMATDRTVFFDYDSYVIRPEFQALIERHAKVIKADKARRVAIEGHTDERGGREYNLALGQKRADAVRRALGLLGVMEGQVESVSFGKEKPLMAGSNEASWAKNRRAEISYR